MSWVFWKRCKSVERLPSANRAPRTHGALFKSDDIDIIVNKKTHESFIFHREIIDYNFLWSTYYKDISRLSFTMSDGRKLDLGVRIQSLVAPHLLQVKEISIVRAAPNLQELADTPFDESGTRHILNDLTPVDGMIVQLIII